MPHRKCGKFIKRHRAKSNKYGMCNISCSVKHSEETSTINGQYICISHSSNCYKCVIGFSGVDNHDKITGNITKNLEVFIVILLILGDLIIKHLNNNKNY